MDEGENWDRTGSCMLRLMVRLGEGNAFSTYDRFTGNQGILCIRYQQIPGTIVGVSNSFLYFLIFSKYVILNIWLYSGNGEKKYLELQENLFPFFPFLTSIS